MTGFEPGPTARNPSMITARPGDLFWNCMQFMGLLCRAYIQWTIHRTVHNKKSSCSLFPTKWTKCWYWICDKQASFILTGYLFKEINRIKGIFERFSVVKWKKKWYDSLNLFPFAGGELLKKCYVVIRLCWNVSIGIKHINTLQIHWLDSLINCNNDKFKTICHGEPSKRFTIVPWQYAYK